MDRSVLFKDLIDPVKELLILLHGSEEDFLYDNWNMLTQLLLTYDKNAGNDEAVRKLLVGIFIDIALEIDADLYFLTTIETFLKAVQGSGRQKDIIAECRQSIENINPKTIEELEVLMSTAVTQSNQSFSFY